jgi:carboxylate-amine ligase
MKVELLHDGGDYGRGRQRPRDERHAWPAAAENGGGAAAVDCRTRSYWSLSGEAERLAFGYERGFSGQPGSTVGLEEELILLDPESLLPANGVELVLARLAGDGRFRPELRAAQLELVSPICLTVADACRELAGARDRALGILDGDMRLAAVGTHPLSTEPVEITPRRRYREIAFDCPWAIRRGLPSGLHVHVAVGDPGEALAVYNAARSYLPEIAALAANSPFFEGDDSGLASVRLKLAEDFHRSGIPPAFGSWREFARFVAWGSHGGAFADLSYLWWDLRPRPDYGTLEFRIADVQTKLADTAAIAALCQSLVAALQSRFRAGLPLPEHETYVLNENRSRAVRDGLQRMLVDPDTGTAQPARDRLRQLLLTVEPFADELGCSVELAGAWSLIAENGAVRQREIAAQRGLPRLVEWLADQTEGRDSSINRALTQTLRPLNPPQLLVKTFGL